MGILDAIKNIRDERQRRLIGERTEHEKTRMEYQGVYDRERAKATAGAIKRQARSDARRNVQVGMNARRPKHVQGLESMADFALGVRPKKRYVQGREYETKKGRIKHRKGHHVKEVDPWDFGGLGF